MADIAAVTFDLWETVLTDPHDVSVARDALRTEGMAAVLGMHPATLQPALDSLRRHLNHLQLAEGDLDTAAQLDYLLARLDGPAWGGLSAVQRSALETAYVEPLFAHPPEPMPQVAAVLGAITARGLPVGLICNTGFTPGSALQRLLTSMGVLPHFRTTFFSGDYGVAKPAARAFHDTVRALGVPAAATIHIGDNPATDVAGAKRAGLQAALLHRLPSPPAAGHGADVVVGSLSAFLRYLDGA